MTKRKALSWLLALCLLGALAAMPGVAGAAEVTPQLDAPASVTFNEDYTITFPKVAASEGRYRIILYKDNVEYDAYTRWGELEDSITLEVGDRIDASGTYSVGVIAVHPNNPELNSPETRSATKEYTLPGQRLDTPTNLRWEKTAVGYTAHWDAAANATSADQYLVTLYIRDTDGTMLFKASTQGKLAKLSTEFDSTFGMKESGVYDFTVTAISTRIDTITHSAESAHSARVTVGDGDAGGEEGNGSVSDDLASIGDVTDGDSADEALNDLKEIGAADLGPAMQGDPAVAGTVADIESAYNDKKGIMVTQDTSAVADEIQGAVKVVGAGFNSSGSNVALKFTKLDASQIVDESQYKNVVGFEIKLDGAISGPLAVPVQITMPIPKGVSPQLLSILHKLGNGRTETIYPRINGDGTVTFTVTEFSPFIFVNQLQQSGSGTTGGSGGDGSWPSDYNPVPPPAAAAPTAPAPAVPTANFYRVMARTLNQRGGPGTNYPVMGKLTQNELIRIVGFSADGLWAQTDSGTWLSMAYLSGTSAVSGAGNFTVNVSSSLNVRSGAGTTSATIGKLYAGAAVRALSVEKGWALIEYNGGTAYVSAMYLK